VLATVVAGPLLACEARSLVPDAGAGSGGGGAGPYPDPAFRLLSDFEDLAGATVVRAGTPPRNGHWYTYNDDNPKGTDATCIQVPPPGPQVAPNPPATYVGEAPPTALLITVGQAGPSVLALHAKWSGCSVWGAGIGADINTPVMPDGEVYLGPKVPYDVSGYSGITFFAMSAPGSAAYLRVKLPMRATTRIQDGGTCDESVVGAGKCDDDWGEQYNLSTNGSWRQFWLTFSGPMFKQEGWGVVVPWNPRDVTGIQIQSVDKGEAYDFWIDDVYLLP